MKKSIFCSTITIVCGLALVTGCARKDLLRQDDKAVSSTTQHETASPVQPPATEDLAGDEIVKDSALSAEQVQDAASLSARKESLEAVYFDFDSHLLSGGSRDKLQRNAQWLSKNQATKVKVEGHTDDRGSDEYNLALGEKRAKSVMDYLVTLGIAQGRLSIISYGEENPAEQGHDEEAWAKNRRAEFVVVER